MATFTSIPQTASFSFKHFDPSSLKRTQSKYKAKVTGDILRKDHGKGAAHPRGLLHQDTEGELRAVSQQTLQVQTTGNIEDVEEMDSAMCDPFAAANGTSVYNFASIGGHYQFGSELLEGGRDHATYVAISGLATNESLDESSRGFYSIGESDAAEEHHGATHVQPSNKAPDYQDKSYHLTTANEGDHVRQRGDLDAGVEHAFPVGDIESPGHSEYNHITSAWSHVDTVKERSPAEDETFSIVGVANGPLATRKRSWQSSVIDDATTITLAAVPNVISDLEPEDPHPEKRRSLAERHVTSPILEPASAPSSTSLLDLNGQVSRPRASDDLIVGPLGAGREGDGATSLDLTDLRDEDDDEDTYIQGTVEELPQARKSLPLSGGTEEEQDIGRDSDRREIDRYRQGSGSKARESFEYEFDQNNKACSIPPPRSRRRKRTDWAPKRRRGLSNTAPRSLGCNTVPKRARQQVRPIQPQQRSMPGRPSVDKGPQSCSPQSSSLGTTAGDTTSIDYRPSLDMSYQITDLTLCTVPNDSSIVTAVIRYYDSKRPLDPAALGPKFFGGNGKVIRMTQLSPDSWMLLGYRCDDDASGSCTGRSLKADWTSETHSDAANHETDYLDDDWDEKSEKGEESIETCGKRTRIPWLESDEVLLLSLKDKLGIEWKEIYKRFPDRTPGAVQVRYYKLHQKD